MSYFSTVLITSDISFSRFVLEVVTALGTVRMKRSANPDVEEYLMKINDVELAHEKNAFIDLWLSSPNPDKFSFLGSEIRDEDKFPLQITLFNVGPRIEDEKELYKEAALYIFGKMKTIESFEVVVANFQLDYVIDIYRRPEDG